MKREPTHVFVQCGVGTLAASAASFALERMLRATNDDDKRPFMVMVEPLVADAFG